jgi:hypothetical protein
VSRLIKALKSTGRRRFACEPSLLFAIDRYPSLRFPLFGECDRGGKPSVTRVLASSCQNWSVQELDACFVVTDNGDQKLAYVYFEDEPCHRSGILTWP